MQDSGMTRSDAELVLKAYFAQELQIGIPVNGRACISYEVLPDSYKSLTTLHHCLTPFNVQDEVICGKTYTASIPRVELPALLTAIGRAPLPSTLLAETLEHPSARKPVLHHPSAHAA